MSSPKSLQQTVMTEASCLDIGRDLAEDRQYAPNVDRSLRALMKEEETLDGSVVATQELPISALKEFAATNKMFYHAQLAFIRQVTTLKAFLPKKVRAHTGSVGADIALCRPEHYDSKDDNQPVDFVRRIVGSDMASFRALTKTENAWKGAVLYEDVFGLQAREVSQPDQLITSIAAFVTDQVSHHVKFKLAEEMFLHSQDRLPTGKGESARS